MTKRSGKGLVWLITWPLAFAGFSCVLIPSASAGMKIDGLTISSDFRYRYEIDRANDKTEDRDRSRIRFRLGFKYAWSDRVEFGARLRTGSNDPQSPHQTLGQFDTGETDTSEEGFLTNKVTGNQLFGLDRAYIKAKWGAGGFGWLGKNQVALWQQYETYWDSDFQPEGAAVGYTMKLGNQGKLTLQGGYYYLTDNSFSGVGEDDAIVPLQALYERGVGPVALTLAVAGAPAIEEDVKLPGRERTYYLYSVQAKLKTLPIPVAVGYEIYHGTRETLGHMVMLRIKPLK
ncbi:MAG: putative porin, partial [Nitrospiraceae bacterium]